MSRHAVMLIVAGLTGLALAVVVVAPSAARHMNTTTEKDNHHNPGNNSGNNSGSSSGEASTPDTPAEPDVNPAPDTQSDQPDDLSWSNFAWPQAPDKAVTPEEKAFAKASLKDVVLGAATFCAVWTQGVGANFYGALLCEWAMAMAVSVYLQANDPPDPRFMAVALPSPRPLSTFQIRCPARVPAGACASARKTGLAYANALAKSSAAAIGLAVSINRFSGARQAGSDPGAEIQAAAKRAYAGELANALAAQRAPARAFAAALHKAGLDSRLTASAMQAAATKLRSPGGVPPAVVKALVADGLTSSAAELRGMLNAIPTRVAPTSIGAVVGAVPPTGALTDAYRSLDAHDVAALVRALANQGAVSGETGALLFDDLNGVLGAQSADDTSAALTQFDTDLGDVRGPAGALLEVAGRALAG